MKEHNYTEIICKTFCRYYKGNKNKIHCGGYDFIRKNLTIAELKGVIKFLKLSSDIKDGIPEKKELLYKLSCRDCDFLADGCDYIVKESSPPCGGYNIINRLISY
jgi:hypothetical protein